MSWTMTVGFLGFLGVLLGAFGAHALKDRLARLGHADAWKTASLYHLVHLWPLLCSAHAAPGWVPAVFLAGICVFSGSLYLLAATGWRVAGAVTPVGGVLLLAGWGGWALSG